MKKVLRMIWKFFFGIVTGLVFYSILTGNNFFLAETEEFPAMILAGMCGGIGALIFCRKGTLVERVKKVPVSSSVSNIKQVRAEVSNQQKTVPVQAQKNQKGKMTKGQGTANNDIHIQAKRSNVRFSDIAGYENTKRSIQFIVSCLKHQENLKNIGAKLPKGILLSGPPGTGKTFMAKAIAGEAGVPFLSVSGSSFMDLYVGQGPRNVRAIYETARAHSPCVIFIDELDAIGGSRDQTDTNSERRNTLNALLVELDGMMENSGVLTIAATNTPDDLDPALVRAGRFDRKIYMPLPDQNERKAILQVHCKNKKIGEDVNFEKLAISTPGFSGATLATLVNEAALTAVYKNHTVVMQDDFEQAMFQIIMKGEPKKNTSEEELRMIAYHEAGHALAVKLVAKEPVPKVTIIGSTSGAGGVTFRADQGSSMLSKSAMEHQIMIAYAGRAAEEIYFGNEQDITTGASSDIRQATGLIRQYIASYGMSGNIGMLNMDILTGRNGSSEDIIREAKELSKKLYDSVLQFLTENKDKLDAVAKALLEKETLFDYDLDRILGLSGKEDIHEIQERF